jgi:REP element-mobilizing transposase RayT
VYKRTQGSPPLLALNRKHGKEEVIMGRPVRGEQFDSAEICIVHAIQRCVRRAFLAGQDAVSGKDYSFRKEWIRRRMESLASVFGIDVLSYAVMSNHLHLIIRNRPDVVAKWDDKEVAIRWLRVFPGRRLEEHLAEPNENDVNSLVNQPQRLALVRERLSDISWFMRALSEPIARLANRQDECSGRFWEGRFKAQRIVDEAGLLACAMYVDLNPIRAAMVERPEQAAHTSAFDRIEGEKGKQIDSAAFDLVPVTAEATGKEVRETPVETLRQRRKTRRRRPTCRRILRDGWLAPLTLAADVLSGEPQVHREGLRASDRGFLAIGWRDYLELLRWTAKQGIDGVAENLPVKLQQLLTSRGIECAKWRDLVWHFHRYFGRSSCAGSPAAMAADAQRTGKHWHRGQRSASDCFAAA